MKHLKSFGIIPITLAGIMLLFSCRAASIELYYIGKVTPAEYAALPSFCQKLALHLSPDLTHNTHLSAEERALTRGLAGGHHYCKIPVLRSRYFAARDANARAFLLTEIIGEASYVIERSHADAPLLPQALVERARAHNDKQQRAEAVKDYLQAISLAPKTATPYLELSRLFNSFGDHAKALDYVTAGLRHNPNSRSLRQRYIELGGKPPFPEPHEPVPAIPNPPATPAPVAPPVTPSARGEPAGPTVPEPSLERPRPSTPDDASPTAGRNGQPPAANPYCRFCP